MGYKSGANHSSLKIRMGKRYCPASHSKSSICYTFKTAAPLFIFTCMCPHYLTLLYNYWNGILYFSGNLIILLSKKKKKKTHQLLFDDMTQWVNATDITRMLSSEESVAATTMK